MEDKQKIINDLRKLSIVKQLINDNEITNQELEDNFLTLYSYKVKINKCHKCQGLDFCEQSNQGFAPNLDYNGRVIIDYLPCKYQKQYQININKYYNLELIAMSFKNFNFEDVFNNDVRKHVLLRIKEIYTSYMNKIPTKGLYIYGPYGCGKSYLLGWLSKKLADEGANVIFAYYPDLVRQIKSSIGDGTLESYLEDLKNIEILVLDDIGGETNTDFIRDEVLGTILQTRMVNNMLTFMSSNLDPALLLQHLSSSSKDVDAVKGSRVFERIHTLMDFIELNDKSYRS